MKDDHNAESGRPLGKTAGEELDALNNDLKRKGGQALRRQMEAGIERKARKRRSAEQPLSAGFKRT